MVPAKPVHFHRSHNEKTHAGRGIAEGLWNSFNSPLSRNPSLEWKTFLDHWERAGRVRALLSSQKFADQPALLGQFVGRLRQVFRADFCFGFVMARHGQSAQVGLPEATASHLPRNFSRHCLSLLGDSRAPVAWHGASAEFGFGSMVVTPVTPPVGSSIGFLMLGHTRRKSYSAAELFTLQALASEVGRVALAVAAGDDHRKKSAAACHNVKNALQVIIGNTSLLGLKLDCGRHDQQKHLRGIETGVQQILDAIDLLNDESDRDGVGFEPAAETVVDLTSTVGQTIAASRRLAEERRIAYEVVYAPEAPGDATLDRAMFIGILDALVRYAALATRDEAVRITVRRNADVLELAVRGMEKDRVAERLQALFQFAAARVDAVRAGIGIAPAQIRKYLDSVGGDVYLKSHAGESAEFIVALPLDSRAQLVGLILEHTAQQEG